MRVLQFSSHNEECGIAKYQEQFIASLSGSEGFYTEFFPHSPYKTREMSSGEFRAVLGELKDMMENFDVLHIQHELSFFKHNELESIIRQCKAANKKVVVTVHTAPHAWYKPTRLGGIGPRSVFKYAKSIASGRRFVNRLVKPLGMADLIIVHNSQTMRSLKLLGVLHNRFQQIKIPVPELTKPQKSTEIAKKLRSSRSDIIFCTVGFLSRMKGIDHAVRALAFLPSNYKLAIIGGNHPGTQDPGYYDEVCDLILELGLQERVHITGYVESDERLNSLIEETDICVFPYDPNYYSYVSSASLNNAFANSKPAVVYPTLTFLELQEDIPALQVCRSNNYYELAREIQGVDISTASAMSHRYAEQSSYGAGAKGLLEIYKNL